MLATTCLPCDKRAQVKGNLTCAFSETFRALVQPPFPRRRSCNAKAQGKGPWLQHNLDNPNQVLYELMEFMACRCYVHNNQQSTVRGYLAAIKLFHKMYAGWELPTSHCMIVAVGKGVERAHGMSQKKRRSGCP